jgi:hypothetical protein
MFVNALMARLHLLFYLLVTPMLAMADAVVNAEQVPNQVGSGIGKLVIGMKLSALEDVLNQKLVIQFAGDRRGGVTITESTALATLRANRLYGSKVEAIDVFFIEDKGKMAVEMLSLGVSCADVPALRMHLSHQETTGTESTYAWGVDTKPTCRLWMRHK